MNYYSKNVPKIYLKIISKSNVLKLKNYFQFFIKDKYFKNILNKIPLRKMSYGKFSKYFKNLIDIQYIAY